MSSSLDFVEYVCDQISCPEGFVEGGLPWVVRYRKMFGEYMVYVNDKPVFLVCDDTVFVKILPEVQALIPNAERGFPYDGAKEHLILDIDDRPLSCSVAQILERIVAVPVKKSRKPKAL